jgi:hypothetical protein
VQGGGCFSNNLSELRALLPKRAEQVKELVPIGLAF